MMGSKFPDGAIGRRSVLAASAKAIGLVGLGLLGCAPRSSQSGNSAQNQVKENQGSAVSGQSGKTMTLSSAAFAADGMIPAKNTCDGQNLSPALSWDEPPAETKSLAVVVTDPDAAGKTHWLLYDLPPDLRQLPEGVPANPLLSQGGTHGKSDFGKFGYGGPCLPDETVSGSHRYVFRLYALDKFLDLPPGASPIEVSKAMEGHTLAQAELIGRYRRP